MQATKQRPGWLSAAATGRRRGLAAALVLVGSVAVGGAIWSHGAGAGETPEPAAIAARGTFERAEVAILAAESTQSSLQGSNLNAARGQSTGGPVVIGAGEEVIASLTGSLTPVAVESSDRGTVVYSSWRQISRPERGIAGQGIKAGALVGIPSVRAYNVATGTDKLVERGAYSPALSLDRRLAFVRGDTDTVRQNVAYTGQIVVGSADGESFESWTRGSARYFTYAWAGSTLLAYKALPDSEAADLYAFTSAGRSRLLAPEAFVIAISPDGERVLVTVGRRMVEVIRVANGAIEASLPLDGPGVAAPDSPTTPHALMFAGSWYGDRVVANSDVGLVVLNVRDPIRIESVIETPGFPMGITEPTLVSDTHLIGWADIGSPPTPGAREEPAYKNALVECDLAAKVCSVGTARPGRSWTRWVTNPSQ